MINLMNTAVHHRSFTKASRMQTVLSLLAISVIFCYQFALADITYRNVSATNLPLGSLTGNSMDARPADLDGDNDLDIVVACEFCPNTILINDGTGVFTDESAARIAQPSHDSEDIGIADFDLDGDLDVVIVSEDDQVNELYLNDGFGFFTDVSDQLTVTGTSNTVLVPLVNNDTFLISLSATPDRTSC